MERLAVTFGGGAVLSSLLLATTAAATERPIVEALHVTSDPCLAAEPLADAVGFWLSRKQLSEPVDFDVRRVGTEVLFVTRRDGAVAGERRLRPSEGTCEELIDAVGLAIALTIDATLLDRIGVEPAPAPAPTPAPTPTPTPTPAPTPAPAPTRRSVRLALDVQGMVLVEVLPGWMGGASVGLDLGFGTIGLRLSGFGATGSAAAVGQTTAGQVSSSLLAGRLDGCARPRWGRLRIGLCSGVVAGAVLADGRGFSPSYSVIIPWVAVAAGVQARWSLTRWLELSAGVDVFLDLLVPRFDLTAPDGSVDPTQSRRASTVGGAITVGPSFVFW